MRPKERIVYFMEYIEGRVTELLEEVWKLPLHKDVIDSIAGDIYSNMIGIRRCWQENPDFRFSQVLISLGILDNIPGQWFYMEDNEILSALGYDERYILFWGQRYDKNMNLLPEVVYRPICDLETDHIKAILDGGWCKSLRFKKCMEKELQLRGHGNS